MLEEQTKTKDQADAQAPVAQAPEKPKGWWDRTREGFQNMMPQWVRDNSSRINQLGLMSGTAVILGSVWRNKKISKDIDHEQRKILKEEFTNQLKAETGLKDLSPAQ